MKMRLKVLEDQENQDDLHQYQIHQRVVQHQTSQGETQYQIHQELVLHQ